MISKRLQITPHLSIEELESRYRQANEGIERSHYQIIWHLAQGQSSQAVAAWTGYSRDSPPARPCQRIYKLVRRYNHLGPDALGDQRRHNPGKAPLLNDLQQAQLWQVLQNPPADGDLWDGPKVAQWMSTLLDRPIHPQRGWEYLKSLELRHRRPRPAHVDSDLEVQTAWKKNCPRSSPT